MSSRTLIVILASALLLAAAVTELSSRLFPGNYFALLALSFIALSVNGLFNVRQLAGNRPGTAPAAPRPGTAQPEQRRTASRSDKQEPRRAEGAGGSGRGESGGEQLRQPRNNRPRRDNDSRSGASAPSGPREEGTVKWFDRSKGFGFVIRPDGEEIFVHQRSIRSDGDRGRPNLADGAAVSFVVTESPRGRQAEDLTLVAD